MRAIPRPCRTNSSSYGGRKRARSAQAVADGVEDLLALGREVVDAFVALGAGGGDAAVEVVEVELERLELELGRRGLELAGADDELRDQAGQGLVARWELAGRRAQAAAEVLGGAAGLGRGEEFVEVGGGEAGLPFVRQREAVGEEGALGLLAAIQHRARAVRRR